MYNKATDLYPWLPERVEIQLSSNENLTLYEIKETFNQDFMEKAHMKRVNFKGLKGDPIDLSLIHI